MKELIIIGAGPAGLSAAVYASRYKLDYMVIGKESGGRINETHKVENYLGYLSLSGLELGQKFREHALALGAEILIDAVEKIGKTENGFEIRTFSGKTYKALNILFALGTEYRKLQISGEKEFRGKGVCYCATCDAPFFRGKKVAVVGGGNSAASAAILLAQYAAKVMLFYRGTELKANPAYLEQLKATENIEIVCCTNLKEIKGDAKVQSIVLDNSYQGSNEVATDGVFIEIGHDPSVDLLIPLGVNINEAHYVITNADQSTNVKGIYAAGDITTNSNGFRQVITAAAEGAIAILSIYERVKEQRRIK
jgi:thioredoxin reductase (NADPH)